MRTAVRHLTGILAAALALCAVTTGAARAAAIEGRPARGAAAMVRIPAGSYRPLYGTKGATEVKVKAFRLDERAVTRGEFQAFIAANPRWARGRVAGVFADGATYLSDWRAPLDAGSADDLRRPVVNVSWFAARAYCRSQGKRLPTVHEWEFAAAASDRQRDATRDPAFVQALVSRYATRPRILPAAEAAPRNAYGVRGLHGMAWEWVEDFNSVIVSDDSRGVGDREHAAYCASAAIGAVDPNNYPAFLRFAVRAGLSGRSTMQTLGFRCAA